MLDVLWHLRGHPAIDVYGIEVSGTQPFEYELAADHYLTAKRPTRSGSLTGSGGIGGDLDGLLSMFSERMGADEGRLRRALTIQEAAIAGSIDILVSTDPLLAPHSRVRWPLMKPDANSFAPEEAIAAIGLYLRSRGDFTITHSGGRSQALAADSFFGGAARALLPSIGDLARVAPGLAGALAGTAVARFGRFLRARDRVQIAAQRPWRRRSHEEVVEALESALVQLVGAFEAAEKAAAASLDNKPARNRSQRRKQLRGSTSGEVLESEAYRTWWEATAELRNTLHDEVLRATTIRSHEPEGNRAWLIVAAREDDRSFGERVRRVLLDPESDWEVASLVVETESLLLVDPAGLIEVFASQASRELNRLGVAVLAEIDGISVPAQTASSEVEALTGVGLPVAPGDKAGLGSRVVQRHLVPGRNGEPLLTTQNPANFRRNRRGG